MQAPIDQSLLLNLPRGPVDIRDTRLSGFVVRVQRSGRASFYVNPARSCWRRLGPVDKTPLHEARAAAETILSTVRRETVKLLAEDAALTHRTAQARARAAVWLTRGAGATLRSFLRDEYGPWLKANRKTGPEIQASIETQFEEFLDLTLAEISAFAIERWRQRRLKEEGVTKSTINRNLANLRGALSRAIDWGKLATHPMRAVKAFSVDRFGQVRFLDVDEESRLLSALTARDEARRRDRTSANLWRQARGYDLLPAFSGSYTDHLTPLVLLALHTGCRQGELFTLRWSDVDLSRRQIRIRAANAKSGRSRVVPLNGSAVAALEEWRPGEIVDPDGLVFPGADGQPLVDVKTAWSKVLRAAAVDRFRFHDLRHTFASKLVQAGVDLNVVRELLGHGDFTTTLRYAHLAPDQGAAAVEKLVSVR